MVRQFSKRHFSCCRGARKRTEANGSNLFRAFENERCDARCREDCWELTVWRPLNDWRDAIPCRTFLYNLREGKKKKRNTQERGEVRKTILGEEEEKKNNNAR